MASPTPTRPDTALRASYDVVIVGAGIAAVSLAFALAQKQGLRDVAVLQPAANAAVAPGPAILRASHSAPAMVRLAGAAAAALRGLPRDMRAELSPLPRPLLELAFTEAGLARLTRLADTARHLGQKAWLVPPLEVRSHLPFARVGVERAVVGALFEPEAVAIERETLARVLAQGAMARGVQLLGPVAVTEMLFEGDAVVGVRTADAEVRAGTVVLAPEAALPRYPGVELPGLGAVAETLFVDSEPAAPIFSTAVVSRRFGTLVQDEAAVTSLSALLRGGGPASLARATHLAALVEAAPGLGGLFLRRQIRARTLTTLDGAPIAGLLRPGLHLLAGLGFEHAGLALPIAEGLAAEISSREPSPLLAPVAPARFASGRLLAPPAEAAAA